MINTWIEQYIEDNPEKSLWEYIQKNPEQTENLIGRSYSEVQIIIEQVKLRYEQKATSFLRRLCQDISLEDKILLTLIKLDQDVSFSLLGRLFQVSESQAIMVFECWQDLLISSDIKPNLLILGNYSSNVVILEDSNKATQNFADSSSDWADFDNFDAVTQNVSSSDWADFDNFDAVAQNFGRYRRESKTNEPLPHDGLFIRRNNDFGTKLTVGIKDLIDQGVLIDQTNIRFDDFVPLTTDRVPSPQQDNSLAVSYGLSSIPLSQKRDDRATHYLEIALKASDVAPKELPKNEAPSVNYIFVVDTSGSMSGEKIDNVKASIRELFSKLREDDVIGIIEFDDRPNTLLKATPVSQIKSEQFSEIISNLRPDGGTDINLAISYGIDEISRYGNNNSLNHIYLFSDGDPTSGETNWIRIRQNVDTKARDAKARGDFRLSTFAFGSDANTKELDALAGLTGGKSTFVTHPDDIKISLQDELSRREHLAAINVQMQIEIDPEIEILYLYGHDQVTDPARKAAVLQDVENAKQKAEEDLGVEAAEDLVTKEKGIRIFVPDLAIGETYWVVFELAIPEEKMEIPVGKVTIQYVDTFVRKNQKPELELSVPGTLPRDLVVEHALALWTSEVAFWTLDDLYENDLDIAKKRIENHVSLLESANKTLNSHDLRDDAIALRKMASLASNLGRMTVAFDSSGYRGSSQPSPVIFALSSFGRVTNGFNRVDYSSSI